MERKYKFGVSVRNYKTVSVVFYYGEPFKRFKGSRHEQKADSYAKYMEDKLKLNRRYFRMGAEDSIDRPKWGRRLMRKANVEDDGEIYYVIDNGYIAVLANKDYKNEKLNRLLKNIRYTEDDVYATLKKRDISFKDYDFYEFKHFGSSIPAVKINQTKYNAKYLQDMLRKLRANTEIRFSSQPNHVLMMEFNYGGEDYLMLLAPMVDTDDEGNKKVVEDSVDDLLIRKPKMEQDPDFDPEKADRNKDGELSDWEIAVGNAVAKGIREHKEKKGAEDEKEVGNCRDCEGTGGLYDSYLGIDDECASCEGTGVMEAETFEAPNPNCSICDGKGWKPSYGDPKQDAYLAKLFGLSIDELRLTPCDCRGAESFEAQTVFTPQQVEDNKEWNERSKRGEFWEDLWWKKEGDRYSNHDDPNLYWNPNSPLANELTEQKERFFKNSILPSKERPKPLETQEEKRAYRNLPPKEKNQIETLGMYWRNVDYLKEGYGISEELAEILESSKMFGMYMNQMINPQMIKKYRTKILKALDSYNPKNPKETHITTTLSSHMKTRPIKGPRPAYDGNSSKPGLGYYYSDYYDLPVPFMGYDYEDLSRFDTENFEADSKPYYEVMVDSSRLDNLNADFDGLTMELQNSLDGYVFSLDYGEGGDEPPMTPSEAKEDYMNQIGITTWSYEPDWDEEKDDYTYGENRPEWQGTINFPEGKSGEGGEFYARVFGFKDGESETEAEEKIMSHLIDNVHVYVRERDEEDGMYYPVDGYYAESFEAEWRGRWDKGNSRTAKRDKNFTYSIRKDDDKGNFYSVFVKPNFNYRFREDWNKSSKKNLNNLPFDRLGNLKIGSISKFDMNIAGGVKGWLINLPSVSMSKKRVNSKNSKRIVIITSPPKEYNKLYDSKDDALEAILSHFDDEDYYIDYEDYDSWGAETFEADYNDRGQKLCSRCRLSGYERPIYADGLCVPCIEELEDEHDEFSKRYEAESFEAEIKPTSYMVKSDAHKLKEASKRIHEQVELGEEYPEWWKSKLSVARNNTDNLADFLDYAVVENVFESEGDHDHEEIDELIDKLNTVVDFAITFIHDGGYGGEPKGVIIDDELGVKTEIVHYVEGSIQLHLVRDMETDELLSVRFSLTGDPEETPIVYLPLPEEITSVPEDDRVSAKN